MTPTTTVIYHNADFDGLFCCEIAKHFLGNNGVYYIGWNHGDKPLSIPDGQIYILDLPVDSVFGFGFSIMGADKNSTLDGHISISQPESRIREFLEAAKRVVWIDHHKSSIETHPNDIDGYRIDGVAACRLAWQWFNIAEHNAQNQTNEALQVPLPLKKDFIDRIVSEPWAVRLAGEYDIWDKRDTNAELFQHGLRSEALYTNTWDALLSSDIGDEGTVARLLNQGRALQYVKTQENTSIIQHSGFTMRFEGLTFLACNHARFNSFLFIDGLKPEHQACLGFAWRGKQWTVSLYHAPGHEDIDLSLIAAKYGGGGHRGACGFTCLDLPFSLKGSI